MRGLLTRCLGVGLALAASSAAGADEPAVSERSRPAELAVVRLRYGAALRSGSQQDLGPGLSYSGFTPNDVALEASYFPSRYLGAAAYGQREGFGLYREDTSKVLSGALVRAHLGPTLRLGFGPARIEFLAGYQFAQLPGFGSSVSPLFASGQRHSALLAARGLVDLGPLSIEVRGELPLPLSVRGPEGGAATSSGYGVGASVRIPLTAGDKVEYAALLDGQLVSDQLGWASDPGRPDDRSHSSQQVTRVGVGLQVRWFDAPLPPPPPRFGSVEVAVVDEVTGNQVSQALVELELDEVRRVLVAGAGGRFRADQLVPGTAVARATAGGYLPFEARAEIVAGAHSTVLVKLKREPPKVGGLAITVADKETGVPIAGATVRVRNGEYVSSPEGAVLLVDLPLGPVAIKVAAPGFKPAQEVASVVAGQRSPVAVSLLKEAARALATITGRVRSTSGGRPIAALLELPQANIRTSADAEGLFTFMVKGGAYSVNISAPGYRSQSKSVVVKDGDQAIFNVDLHPK